MIQYVAEMVLMFVKTILTNFKVAGMVLVFIETTLMNFEVVDFSNAGKSTFQSPLVDVPSSNCRGI